MKAEIDSPWYKFCDKCTEILTGVHPEEFLPKGATNPFWRQNNQWKVGDINMTSKEELPHEIEFIYDGCDAWAYNGGTIMGPNLVKSYIGREAFFEALKYYRSLKVKMKISIEPIEPILE